MENSFNEGLKFFITMISVLNPVGIIPIYLTLTKGINKKELQSIAKACSLTVMITIIVSLVIGKYILSFFGIGVGAFTVAGGILIFMMAFQMIQAKTHHSKLNQSEKSNLEEDHREIGVVPLAIPLLSGPGAISTSIISSNHFKGLTDWAFVIVAVLLIGILIKVVLSSSRRIGDKLGTLGLNVMTRIMGLILLALSIEMIAAGLKKMLAF